MPIKSKIEFTNSNDPPISIDDQQHRIESNDMNRELYESMAAAIIVIARSRRWDYQPMCKWGLITKLVN